ncbi:MAG: nucleotidyltransferase domain-containing protein [Ilumatobacteraceae bacterium]
MIPSAIEALVDSLGQVSGVEAITIGGSRATGTADATSDWDLGIFYRGQPDFGVLSTVGTLHSPGSWGRFMNG